IGTIWAYLRLEEVGSGSREPIDWWGNVTFGIGLTAILVGITYGIQPYNGQAMGWGNPVVLSALGLGVLMLVLFFWIEPQVQYPLFDLSLFRIRAFTAGNIAGLLASMARGGLQFMLVIWLQGIWLPLHGYDYADTPLWAGIYLLPLTFGFLLSGPVSGYLSDRYGARPFATSGMLCSALAFALLAVLPIDFSYPAFAGLLLLMGLSMGAFASPNRAGVMNSLPHADRGAGGGMNQTFQNSAQVLSIGIFFTLMIVGLSATLPHTLASGLTAHGVPPATAKHVSTLPPVSVLFA